jgi:uncharacterized membrane protein YkoI
MMAKPSYRFLIMFLGAAFTVLTNANAQEKKITKADLPVAVQKTVDAQTPGAAIRGFSTEIENGKRIYEAELMVSGRTKDISMDKDGNIIENEEEVALDSLPTAVRDGLTHAAGSGTITKVEALTKNNKLVAYEAAVKNGSKRSEIQVGPDGKKLAHPE